MPEGGSYESSFPHADGVRDLVVPDAGQVTTMDLDRASAVLSSLYSDVTVHVPRKEPVVRIGMHRSALGGVNLAKLTMSRAAIVGGVPYPYYTVVLPTRGETGLSTKDESVRMRGALGVVVSPGTPARGDYLSDYNELVTVVISRQMLETELSMMLGRTVDSPVRFEFAFPAQGHSPLHQALRMLTAELTDPAAPAKSPLVAKYLGRLVVSGLLLSHPHHLWEELVRPAGFQGPQAIRAALAAIEERPTEIVTVGDIAAAVGLSVRALDDGFRRHVGVSPMRYLRHVRLDRARAELLRSDPEQTTATFVAQNWGFDHYGRFAAEYRQRFGCSPSETLRRKEQ